MNSFDISELATNFTGETIVAFILSLARWLTGEGTPGWVSLRSGCMALVALSLWYEIITWRFVRAVRSVRRILRIEGDGKFTRERLVDINQKIGQCQRAKGRFYRALVNRLAGVQ